MATLYFKTNSPFFEKERDNLKCNTVRELKTDDVRFECLLKLIQTGEKATISIINPNTNEKFIRNITDVTYFNERFIISWEKKGGEE